MRLLAATAAAAAFALSGCAVASAASTAVDIATLPVKAAKTTVKAASAGVDAVTTSQSELDQKEGRRLRQEDERRGRDHRAMAERCRKGRPLPADDCSALAPRR